MDSGKKLLSSFDPIADDKSRVLILGTMPGVQSLHKHEYYGNERNAFWRIVFSLFNEELSGDYAHKKKFLLEHGIALWDVLKHCEREGSGDDEIKEPVPNDFEHFFKRYPNIRAVYFNGGPAEKFYERLVGRRVPAEGKTFLRLPSTSPANAQKFEDKMNRWKMILLMLEDGTDMK